MPRLRLAVLVSGRGSNLENLLAAARDGHLDADIALVVSNRPEAPAVEIARRGGVPLRIIESVGRTREAHESDVQAALADARPDLVVLAGYMRILTPSFLRAWTGRLINIHPSLLPAFPGMDAQRQAHERNVRIAGCTVHFVTEQVDGGPILAQAAIAIPAGATPDDVNRLILDAEHRLYPYALQLLATGRARLEAGRVVYSGTHTATSTVVISP